MVPLLSLVSWYGDIWGCGGLASPVLGIRSREVVIFTPQPGKVPSVCIVQGAGECERQSRCSGEEEDLIVCQELTMIPWFSSPKPSPSTALSQHRRISLSGKGQGTHIPTGLGSRLIIYSVDLLGTWILCLGQTQNYVYLVEYWVKQGRHCSHPCISNISSLFCVSLCLSIQQPLTLEKVQYLADRNF